MLRTAGTQRRIERREASHRDKAAAEAEIKRKQRHLKMTLFEDFEN